ncbi:MAG: ParB/RepB/Spo0J family partition protein [Candidatus Margulisiibacteriota bacterium]|jgi:ParB family chromosome partitioning protein
MKRGLGRGLDVLIPQRTTFASGRTILNVSCAEVRPNPYQPRKQFDEQKLVELSNSIKEHGIVQPIVVRRTDDGYELVAGERRLRAAKLAGLENIPAIIRDYTNDQSIEVGLIENIQREALNPMEEARAYKRLAEEFELTQEEIAKKVGKSRSVIANATRLLNLPEEIQESISAGLLSSGHGRTLVSIIDSNEQVSVWQKMLEGAWNVRQAEAATRASKPAKARKKAERAPGDFVLTDLAETLSRHLATKVSINGDRNKGSLVIHYFSQEDLERIVEGIV